MPRQTAHLLRGFSLIGVALLVAVSTSTPAMAQMIGFRSPSGNIHCMFDPGDAGPPAVPSSVRCDLRDITGATPPRPRTCDADWGRSYAVTQAAGEGQIICAGDAVFSDDYPVLDYGAVWQQGGFTCLSEADGVSCFNARRHGFKLSRSARQTF